MRTIAILTILIFSACDRAEYVNSNDVKSDTTIDQNGYFVKFYSKDSRDFDSSHWYKYAFDSVFLIDRIINRNKNESDYIALISTDTTIWGANHPSNTLTIIGSIGIQTNKLIKIKNGW